MDILQNPGASLLGWKKVTTMMPLLLPVAKNNYVAKRLTSFKDEGTTDPLKDSMMHNILTLETERKNLDRRYVLKGETGAEKISPNL
jgi:hypothetical protein